MAKIPYVERANTTPEIQAMYDQLEKKFGVVPNVIKAMANSPKLLPGFLTLLGASLGPTEVDAPLKELAILTTSKINGCRYCAAHHTAAGKRAGLTKEKLDATPDYSSSIFDEKERAVVRFANEVTENVAASEESLNELGKFFNESQIAELNIVIGVFNLLTRFADTFKVDLEH
ncbi:MAG: carboxymuconolactone decarboxylase family protein [Thermodesulfobacteriota bacterium]